MLEIVSNDNNALHYVCDCGSKGVCYFRSEDKNTAMVVDIKCPNCDECDRLTLLHYNSKESKESILKNMDNLDLSWVPSFVEEV